MSKNGDHAHISYAVVALAAVVSAGVRARGDADAPPMPPSACDAATFHQFDFFLGDWDTFDVAAPRAIVARNRVTPMLDGCALREVYEQTDGLRGESVSTYDVGRRVWHQSWVTNRGTMLLLDGTFANGRLTFTATDRSADGTASLVRVAWWPAGPSVRERAERSRDGGKSWTTMFDVVFVKHR